MRLGALLLALAGCSQGMPPGFTSYTSGRHGFTLNVPQSWRVLEYDSGLDVVSFSDDRAGAVMLVQVHEFEGEETPEEFYKRMLRSYKGRQFKELDQGAADGQGIEGWRVVGEAAPASGPSRNVEYHFTRQGRGFRIVCVAVPESFDAALPKFDAACRSFGLTGGR